MPIILTILAISFLLAWANYRFWKQHPDTEDKN